MPRGIPKSRIAGEPMTSEDLALAEQRTEGKRGLIHENDFELPKGKVVETPDGRKITQVGNFQSAPVFGDSQTLKKFAPIKPDYTGWIKVTNAEALLYQDLRVMAGHDGDLRLGLIDLKKLDKLKQDAKNGLLTEFQMEALAKLEEIQ